MKIKNKNDPSQENEMEILQLESKINRERLKRAEQASEEAQNTVKMNIKQANLAMSAFKSLINSINNNSISSIKSGTPKNSTMKALELVGVNSSQVIKIEKREIIPSNRIQKIKLEINGIKSILEPLPGLSNEEYQVVTENVRVKSKLKKNTNIQTLVNQRKIKSATTIQRIIRGYISRKRYIEMIRSKEKQNENNKLVIKIQVK